MKKAERIEKAETIKEIIDLLSKRQLRLFGAVISFFQIHNNWNYYLDERESNKYLIEFFIGKRLLKEPIVEQRKIVSNYIELHINEEATQTVIDIAKAIINKKSVKEINDIAKL